MTHVNRSLSGECTYEMVKNWLGGYVFLTSFILFTFEVFVINEGLTFFITNKEDRIKFHSLGGMDGHEVCHQSPFTFRTSCFICAVNDINLFNFFLISYHQWEGMVVDSLHFHFH